jgi:murein L,D-transpeptidase YcbB/YkuD
MNSRHIAPALLTLFLFLNEGRMTAQTFLEPGLVSRFYRNRQQPLFWFAPDPAASGLRGALLDLIDSSSFQGLDSTRYLASTLHAQQQDLLEKDEWYTDAALTYLKDLRSGHGIYDQVTYDGVSPAFVEKEDDQLLTGLAEVHDAAGLRDLAASFIPSSAAYDTLRYGLLHALSEKDRNKADQLAAAVNAFRWIHNIPSDRLIVVNVAAARLTYYEKDTVRLQMKIVAGQPSKRTPRFAAWCDQIIVYPYWNIPRKIAVTEFLPLFRVSPALAETMNIQLLDQRGRIVDPSRISWSKWNKDNFPYAMRQSTGCDNALGVIKFNLTSPYDVYMHDTNFKLAFLSSYRWRSHGCIRLEKPLELGTSLLGSKLDTVSLQSCLKDQQPHAIRLEEPIPVFVLYQTADIGPDGKLSYSRDIYHLSK